LIDLLRHHYAHRLEAAREAHAAGSGVVGLVGNTIPRELVLARGYVPVLISAELGAPTPGADVYMEDVIPPETKALFELATRGDLEFLDLLVLSRPYAQLYYYLKEVYRLGRAPRLPALHMFDLMQSQREAVRVYNTHQLAALGTRLGHQHGDSELRSAIELTNRVRALQRELIARRWERTLSGCDALQAIGAGYFMAPQAYVDVLSACLSQLTPDSDLAHRPRVLVLSSEPLSQLHLHRALEASGALVIAEDDWWGSRAPGMDIASDAPLNEVILQKYWHDAANSQVTPAEPREVWFKANALRDEVDAVVFYLPPSDHQLGWDFPRLKAWLDDHAKPSLRLRSDDPAQISAELGGWLPTLAPSGVAGR